MAPLHNAPFTPDSLGKRWGCSGQHIRNMIKRGEIPAFSVGKLLRIPADWVFAQEQAKHRPADGDAGTRTPAAASNETTRPRLERPTVTLLGVLD